MTVNDRADDTLNLEMPIYDGSRPVAALLPDLTARRLYRSLWHMLISERGLDEITHWMSIQLALKALLIRQYMQQQGIENIREGIRQFRTFQRRQLLKRIIRCTPTIGHYSARRTH